jgi:thiol-disulfide isomerase/thioredoxin
MVNYLNKISKEELINFQKNAPYPKVLIIKFTANWCGPCKKIKEDCINLSKQCCDNITYCEIDIDEHIELYAFLKNKRMVNGIPSLLSFRGGNKNINEWYIPTDSIIGANKNDLLNFFKRCNDCANK